MSQLVKLQMLEFYYELIDKYLNRWDFELCYMDGYWFILLSNEWGLLTWGHQTWAEAGIWAS